MADTTLCNEISDDLRRATACSFQKSTCSGLPQVTCRSYICDAGNDYFDLCVADYSAAVCETKVAFFEK